MHDRRGQGVEVIETRVRRAFSGGPLDEETSESILARIRRGGASVRRPLGRAPVRYARVAIGVAAVAVVAVAILVTRALGPLGWGVVDRALATLSESGTIHVRSISTQFFATTSVDGIETPWRSDVEYWADIDEGRLRVVTTAAIDGGGASLMHQLLVEDGWVWDVQEEGFDGHRQAVVHLEPSDSLDPPVPDLLLREYYLKLLEDRDLASVEETTFGGVEAYEISIERPYSGGDVNVLTAVFAKRGFRPLYVENGWIRDGRYAPYETEEVIAFDTDVAPESFELSLPEDTEWDVWCEIPSGRISSCPLFDDWSVYWLGSSYEDLALRDGVISYQKTRIPLEDEEGRDLWIDHAQASYLAPRASFWDLGDPFARVETSPSDERSLRDWTLVQYGPPSDITLKTVTVSGVDGLAFEWEGSWIVVFDPDERSRVTVNAPTQGEALAAAEAARPIE